MTSAARHHNNRNADLAAIHMAKAALQWSDDEYRDVMASVCGGVRSAGSLDFAGRKRFLAHLQACQTANKRQPGQRPARVLPGQLLPEERLMWSLWMQLADAKLVRHRSMRALTSYAFRQTGVDSIRFLNDKQQELVIESLKRWLQRGPEQAQ